MKTTNFMTFSAATVLVLLLAACGEKTQSPTSGATLPQVNDENCKPENVLKVDAAVRQAFGDACFRRGSFKPSSGKSY